MSDNNGIQLSARETECLALAWQCFETEPKVDMAKFAQLTGYTEGSASVTLGRIKRKLKSVTSSDNPRPAPGRNAGTPKTPRKRATKANDKDDGTSPTKKRRTPAGKKAAPAPAAHHQDDDDDDDEEEFNVLKVKKEEFDANPFDNDDGGAAAFYDQAAAYAAGGGYPEDSEDGI